MSKKLTPAYLAGEAARLIKAYGCDSRAFDDCFEQGNGTEVVVAFMRLYACDAELRGAVERQDRYINIAAWKKTAEQAENPLFAQQP